MKSILVRAVMATASVALLAACGGFTGTSDTTRLSGSSGERVLVPAGYGTLAQDEFTLTLQSGPLQVKVTPLAESVIRLGAPDTYERLAGIAGSARTSLLSLAGRDASLFLVSFFSREPTVRYEPESLQIVNGGLRYRPTAIHAVTPGWGGQRLRQQETQIAVYAFDRVIDLELTLAVEYEGARNTSWAGILHQLELERARVRGRVGGGAISPDPSETPH